jgi:hypothetical protein
MWMKAERKSTIIRINTSKLEPSKSLKAGLPKSHAALGGQN